MSNLVEEDDAALGCEGGKGEKPRDPGQWDWDDGVMFSKSKQSGEEPTC